MTVDKNTKTSAIVQAIEEKYNQTIPMRQAQKVKIMLAGRHKKWARCKGCGFKHHGNANCKVGNPPPSSEEGSEHESEHDGEENELETFRPIVGRNAERSPQRSLPPSLNSAPVSQARAIVTDGRQNVPEAQTRDGAQQQLEGAASCGTNGTSGFVVFHTRKEAQLEASRLMHKAAALMSEAAIYNAQAAMLMTSLSSMSNDEQT